MMDNIIIMSYENQKHGWIDLTVPMALTSIKTNLAFAIFFIGINNLCITLNVFLTFFTVISMVMVRRFVHRECFSVIIIIF